MALNHGINTYRSDTESVSVTKAQVGIPFFVGAWPVHLGAGYNPNPVLINNFDEAKRIGGYSSTWRYNGNPYWSLCQAAFGFFQIAGMGPAIFMNVFDPATHKTAEAPADMSVVNHAIKLPTANALDDSGLTVASGETALTRDTDYTVARYGNYLTIELISGSTYYSATTLKVGYNKANPTAITAAQIEAAFEKVELCKTMFNVVPDLFCAPGWSKNPAVAAVMAAKAPSINGLFRAKAVVDLDTSVSGADTYDDVLTYKNANGYTDENMIVCWPLVKVKTNLFDYSVLICGALARCDSDNGDLPYESPSNKSISVTGLYNAAGDEIFLTPQQADAISYSAGVVTALNFGGFVVWGNYTGCWPSDPDVAKCFIPTTRMLDFLCNTFVNTYWSYLDRPLTRVLIDAIVNDFNAYLDGLTAAGALYGGELKYIEDVNPEVELLAGRFRLDLQAASPVPAQQINLYSEFSVTMLTDALTGSING